LAPGVSPTPVNGRVYVIVSHNGDSEPRFQTDVADPVPFWGKDATLRPNRGTVLGGGNAVYGYPLEKIPQLPPRDYYVQAFMNVYTTFHRSDGSVVDLHMPCGDGDNIFSSTGNLYSDVVHTTLGPRSKLSLDLTHVIPPRDAVPPGGTCQQGNPA